MWRHAHCNAHEDSKLLLDLLQPDISFQALWCRATQRTCATTRFGFYHDESQILKTWLSTPILSMVCRLWSLLDLQVWAQTPNFTKAPSNSLPYTDHRQAADIAHVALCRWTLFCFVSFFARVWRHLSQQINNWEVPRIQGCSIIYTYWLFISYALDTCIGTKGCQVSRQCFVQCSFAHWIMHSNP